jgi:hypothetical protein
MNEFLIILGTILVTVIGSYYFILCAIANARIVITAKQDALMAKLIEIKLR